MKPNLGITPKNLTAVNEVLNKVLADGNVLYIKLRKFHWNLSGDNFMELHLLFEDQHNAVAEAIDEVAERISTLGGVAIGTTTEFAKMSQLKENPGKLPSNQEMLKELVSDHESIVKASTEYGAHIHASVEKDNVFACQFHPEKSADVGMQILRNFLEV